MPAIITTADDSGHIQIWGPFGTIESAIVWADDYLPNPWMPTMVDDVSMYPTMDPEILLKPDPEEHARACFRRDMVQADTFLLRIGSAQSKRIYEHLDGAIQRMNEQSGSKALLTDQIHQALCSSLRAWSIDQIQALCLKFDPGYALEQAIDNMTAIATDPSNVVNPYIRGLIDRQVASMMSDLMSQPETRH